MQEDLLKGVVISIDATGATVDAGGEKLFCRVRGRFYEDPGVEKRPIAPGDDVTISRTSPGEGAIEEILPRRSKLSRPSGPRGDQEQVIAANIDQLAIVVAVRKPRFRLGLIDRLVVAATNHRLAPLVVVNKIDLDSARAVEEIRETYEALGYPVLPTCALKGIGLDRLVGHLVSRVTVFTGHSGVGKSTLINSLDPSLGLRTGEVSRHTSKGRHVTTRATLIPLPQGGYVVDTPGIRAFGLWDLERADLDIFFREFEPLIEQCRFHNCTHTHEPECAVRGAVESGELSKIRYAAYVRIYETLEH